MIKPRLSGTLVEALMSTKDQVEKLKGLVKDVFALRKRHCWLAWFGIHPFVWDDKPFIARRTVHSNSVAWLYQMGHCRRCGLMKQRELGPPRSHVVGNKESVTHILHD